MFLHGVEMAKMFPDVTLPAVNVGYSSTAIPCFMGTAKDPSHIRKCTDNRERRMRTKPVLKDDISS